MTKHCDAPKCKPGASHIAELNSGAPKPHNSKQSPTLLPQRSCHSWPQMAGHKNPGLRPWIQHAVGRFPKHEREHAKMHSYRRANVGNATSLPDWATCSQHGGHQPASGFPKQWAGRQSAYSAIWALMLGLLSERCRSG